jgi:NADH dehydrogenase (ubiquinone) 1 alpha subcomplex subunit 12
MSSFVLPIARALKEFGLRATLKKMYVYGDIKFGAQMGIDKFGNAYFDNTKDYSYGQHRWVEYADTHNFCPSNVPPDWHAWLHHMSDSTPCAASNDAIKEGFEHIIPTLQEPSNAPYTDHLGGVISETEEQHNWSTVRSRGYKVGSLKQGQYTGDVDDAFKGYLQPGSPLHADTDKPNGRFTKLKVTGVTDMDANTSKGEPAPRVRSLSEL